MPSVLGVRLPATRRCVLSSAAALEPEADGLPELLDAEDGGPGQDLDPLVPEELLLTRPGHVRIFAVDQRGVPLDDGLPRGRRNAWSACASSTPTAPPPPRTRSGVRGGSPDRGPRRGQRGDSDEAGRLVDPRAGPRQADHDGLRRGGPSPARVEGDLEGLRGGRIARSLITTSSAPLSRYFSDGTRPTRPTIVRLRSRMVAIGRPPAAGKGDEPGRCPADNSFRRPSRCG